MKVLPTLVRVLLAEGWLVEAEGRLYRQPGTMALDVRSGIDWFELHGGVDFDGIRRISVGSGSGLGTESATGYPRAIARFADSVRL